MKTHRLPLLALATLLAPGVPDATNISRLTIGPKVLKDLLDHFPISKSSRSDPQLVWTFDATEIGLKSVESAIDSRGALSTFYTRTVFISPLLIRERPTLNRIDDQF